MTLITVEGQHVLLLLLGPDDAEGPGPSQVVVVSDPGGRWGPLRFDLQDWPAW